MQEIAKRVPSLVNATKEVPLVCHWWRSWCISG